VVNCGVKRSQDLRATPAAWSSLEGFARMRRINFKFLLILMVGLTVLIGSLFVVRRFQVSRNAGGKLSLARTRLKEGKMADALVLLGQYVTLRPDDSPAFAEYSKLLLTRATKPDATRNDVARAFTALEEAVRRNPDEDELREQLADFQIRVGRASDALEHLDVLESHLPKQNDADADGDGGRSRRQKRHKLDILKARSYESKSEFQQAATILARLVGYDMETRKFAAEVDDDAVETNAYTMLAEILQERMESPDDARAVLEELISKRGDEPRAWLAMSAWHRKRGGLEEAEAAVAKAVELAPDDADGLFSLYEVTLAQGKHDRLLEIARRAVDLFPDEERSYRALAAACIQLGDAAGAEEALLDGIDRLPAQSTLVLMLVDTLLQQNKLAQASQALNRAIEIYGPTNERVGLLEARLMIAEGRWKEARDELERIRPLLLGNGELVSQVDLYLGQVHAQLNEFDAQLEVNRRVLADNPNSLAARVGSAQALFSAGKLVESLAEFEAIAAALPDDRIVVIPEIWYPLLQLRITALAGLPEAERDWSVVDGLLDNLGRSGTLSAAQMAMLRAEALVRRGESQAAADVLEAVDATEATPQLWSALVALALRTSGPEQARTAVGRAPERFKNTPELLIAEAQVIARSPPAESLAALDELEKRITGLEPSDAARVLATVAAIRLAAGDREGSERLWREAAEKQPDNPLFREAVLEIAIASGDLEKARTLASQISGIAGPESARSRAAEASVKILQARQALGRIRAASSEPLQRLPDEVTRLLDEARSTLIAAENERPRWSSLQTMFAEIDELRGDRTAAIERLRRAITVGSTNPAIVRRLVAMLYLANRLEEAQEAMALLGEEGSKGLERISAEVELRAGQFDEAVALAEQSVAGDTQNPEDLLWLGQLLARSGKRERADEALERATALAPDNPEVWLALFTHRVAVGSTETAEAALDRAAALMPEPRRQLVRAQGYEILRRPSDAERILGEALAGWPENFEVVGAFATFQIRNGHVREARGLLEKLIASDSAAATAMKPTARRALAEVEGSRGTYRQLQDALRLLQQNRAADGTVSIDDVDLEIKLLTNRREPASWRRAIQLLDQLADRRSLTNSEQLTHAQLQEKVGDWDAARGKLIAIVASPKTPPAFVALLIEKLLEHGEVSTAETWLRRLEKSSSDSVITVALTAKLAKAKNDRKEAANIARRLMPAGDVSAENAAQLKALAQLMEDLDFPKAADQILEQYAGLSTDGVMARIQFLGRQSRTDEALDLLKSQWENMSLERALSLAVEVLRSQPDDVTAMPAAARISPWVEKARLVDPGSLVIRLVDAEVRTMLGREAEAEGIYRDLLGRRDLDARQTAIIANNLAFHLAKPKTASEARKLIDTAMAELGPLPDLLDTRGLVSLAQGDHGAALTDLRDAVLEPTATKYLHLAAAEMAAGNSAAAKQALETARRKGLDKARLVPQDATRLKDLESELPPAPQQPESVPASAS